MDLPYHPISCSVHDQLLELATLRQECVMEIETEDSSVRTLRGTIVDLYTRDGGEYLEMNDGTIVRLDRIRNFNPLPG